MPFLIVPAMPNDSPALAMPLGAHRGLRIERRAVLVRARASAPSPAEKPIARAELGVRRDDFVGQDRRRRVLLEGVEDHFERRADVVAAAEVLDRRFEQHGSMRSPRRRCRTTTGRVERLLAPRQARPVQADEQRAKRRAHAPAVGFEPPHRADPAVVLIDRRRARRPSIRG